MDGAQCFPFASPRIFYVRSTYDVSRDMDRRIAGRRHPGLRVELIPRFTIQVHADADCTLPMYLNARESPANYVKTSSNYIYCRGRNSVRSAGSQGGSSLEANLEEAEKSPSGTAGFAGCRNTRYKFPEDWPSAMKRS